MNTQKLAQTKLGRVFVRTMARIMESRLRYRFFGPVRILQDAEIRPGQAVLEVGCGTGFFTLPAARRLGDQGSLVAMDVLPESVEAVTRKMQAADVRNVRVVRGDALDTRMPAGSFDAALIFGVIPAPMLPMDRLLAEMHRVLKPGGVMAVWPPSGVNRRIVASGLFAISSRRNGVWNYKRTQRS
ncbi:MAG: class I SAM-dependent methyltransferase [Anaerolineales bacterium]